MCVAESGHPSAGGAWRLARGRAPAWPVQVYYLKYCRASVARRLWLRGEDGLTGGCLFLEPRQACLPSFLTAGRGLGLALGTGQLGQPAGLGILSAPDLSLQSGICNLQSGVLNTCR